eukprot:236521-Prorocentrum_minimum.AAC.1
MSALRLCGSRWDQQRTHSTGGSFSNRRVESNPNPNPQNIHKFVRFQTSARLVRLVRRESTRPCAMAYASCSRRLDFHRRHDFHCRHDSARPALSVDGSHTTHQASRGVQRARLPCPGRHDDSHQMFRTGHRVTESGSRSVFAVHIATGHSGPKNQRLSSMRTMHITPSRRSEIRPLKSRFTAEEFSSPGSFTGAQGWAIQKRGTIRYV